MPFGAVYAALFFAVIAVSSASDAAFLGEPPASVRLSLALLAGALALGLALRRSWARWGGALLCGLLAAHAFAEAGRSGGVTALLVLFGAAVAVGLLLVPVTGRPAPRPAVPVAGRARGSRAVGLVAALALVGLAISLARVPRQATDGVPPAYEASAAADAAEARAVPAAPDWHDYRPGIERARSEGRPVLVAFVTDWCGYCRKLESTTWRDPAVRERLARLVAVKVDAEETRERHGVAGGELARRFGVRGYPTLLLLDSDGAVVSRAGGYLDPRGFIGWLDDGLQRLGGPARAAAGTLPVSGRER